MSRTRTGLRHVAIAGLASLASFAMAQTEPVLSGTFVQLNSQLAGMSAEGWLQELGWMHDVGMDTVIVQYARYGEAVYYPEAEARAPVVGELPPNESIATLTWHAPPGTSSRYLRIVARPNSREWTMIPEVRVFSGGQNVAQGLGYRVSPAPDGRYPDPDATMGGKLTDGSANFAWPDMVGWVLPDEIRIDLTFPGDVSIERVEVDFMRSDISGVELPSGSMVQVSGDGATYAQLGESVSWGAAEAAPAWEPLRHMLAAAEQLDMQIWLGLGLDPSFWQGQFDAEAAAAQNIGIMQRLHELYGASPALAGWYLPEEINDRTFVGAEIHEAMIRYLTAVADAAHEQTGKPVMVAPYFGMTPDGPAYATWWDTTLERADIDVIAMQDGVGTRRTTTEEGVPVFAALAEVAAKHGVALWSDLEIFEQVHGWPVDEGAWQARPADIERVIHQLELEAPYVEKFVAFDFAHYMSPRLGGEAAALYDAYRAYVEGRASP